MTEILGAAVVSAIVILIFGFILELERKRKQRAKEWQEKYEWRGGQVVQKSSEHPHESPHFFGDSYWPDSWTNDAD